MPPLTDAAGKNEQQRFEEIRRFFLELLAEGGHSRKELYYRPKPGDAREPTEEEVVKRWAASLDVPLGAIKTGIARAFQMAADRGGVVVSFRYCVPHIINAATEEVMRARVPL